MKRSKRRLAAYVTCAVLLPLAFALIATARTRYTQPPEQFPQFAAEFVPRLQRRVSEHTVVLLVFDGLAPATVRAAQLPVLARLAREGAHALDMLPVFPTLSLPNHFSLSTGCYPERHGVVSNHFLDPERGVYNNLGDADWLLDCEPLHVVAERQGLRAAVYGSVAASSTRTGKLATIAEPFRKPAPDVARQVDRIIAQLGRGDQERPALITAYVTEPDTTSHRYGPTAPETLAQARRLDAEVGRVVAAIERSVLRDRVTLIVTTDHGMASAERFVSVERVLRQASVPATVLAQSTLAHVYLDNHADKARALAALAKHAALEAFDPARPPDGLHLGQSARLGQVVVGMKRGYWTADSALWPWYLRWANYVGDGMLNAARFTHGYAPEQVPEMRAVFYAWGGRVAPGVKIEGLRSVDVHPTVTRLLGIEPGLPLDGVAHRELILPRN